ncbi:MAG: type II/IV secretion system protein [Planctomycetota bacterium]|nr:MAG: type II/IV secretion system protein [Planctomycetota bacterium]
MSTLAEILVESGQIEPERMREAQALQRNRGTALADVLVKNGYLDETSVYRALAKEAGLPFVDLAKGKPPAALAARVPRELALEQGLVPVAEKNGKLVVAIDDPHKRLFVEQLAFVLGGDVGCALAAPGPLARALAALHGQSAEEAVAAGAKVERDANVDEAPIIRLVARMLQDALDARASDVHVEPQAGRLRVRFRIDGMLREVAEHPLHLAAPVTSRLKIMASMDIAEKRKPQDGRIELEMGGRAIDVRCSILPSNHGESIVMRLLDRTRNLIGLAELGFGAENHAWFKRMIRRPHGIVLVTGPTGSGKTTTLYAALSEINRPDVKIITAEDPVEYHIAGINQVQVNPRIGLSFARILKAMLRAAPNVILVGEIRDKETAEVAIQAALTGHLVFSTLHTNDAPSAITRLVDIGVAPFLVSTAVQAVVAQRLVRKLCTECAQEYEPHPGELAALAADPKRFAGRKLKRARGCRACDGHGYRGRLGLFELFELDSGARDLIFRGAPLVQLRAHARAEGKLRLLLEDGQQKVADGLTSIAEVLRVTRAAEEHPDGGARGGADAEQEPA